MSDLFLSVETKANFSQTLDSKHDLNSSEEFLNVNSKAKELSGQVEWVITHRKSDYLAEFLNLQNHKSVSIRRKVAIGLGLLGSVAIVPRN